MRCPKCRFKYSRVFDVRKYMTFILRSRRCKKCRHEWKTQETEIPYGTFVDKSFEPEINGPNKDKEQNKLFS